MSRLHASAAAVAALVMTACSASSPPSRGDASTESAGFQVRLLVKLVQPSSDPAEVTRRVAAVAGRPVRYAAATSPEWHAVVLRCGATADCHDAVRRLKADAATFREVEADAVRSPGAGR